jgi:hypothetical protein
MRLFIFKSDSNTNLRAFTGDLAGQHLPSQFKPWHAIGAVADDAAMPHRFEREPIEREITARGYQLWRFKDKSKSQSDAAPKAVE